MTWEALPYLVVGLLIGYVLGKVENYIREMRRGVLRLEVELRVMEGHMLARIRETQGLCRYVAQKVDDVEDKVEEGE